jgi:hypothetical protein
MFRPSVSYCLFNKSLMDFGLLPCCEVATYFRSKVFEVVSRNQIVI